MLKKQFHSPTHLFLDKTPYFITGAIYQKRPLLADSAIKQDLLSLIKKNFHHYHWQLKEYVILDNHYHLLGISDQGKDLSKLMKAIHGASSHLIRQKIDCELPVWWNYWDYCPRDEKDYYTKQNYLFINPIKHGYVDNLNDYLFSSFLSRLSDVGRETMVKQFRDYPKQQQIDDIYDDF